MASKNPQIAYGNEVISRIGYTIDHEGGLKELQGSAIEGSNQSLAELEKLLRLDKGIRDHIYEVGAIAGAITRFRMVDDQVCLETLGGKHPVGVCGSRVIDPLAELLRHGIMNRNARIQRDCCFGNGALAGARVMLCSHRKRREVEDLGRILTHLKPNEIEGQKFQDRVADNIYFN